MHAVLQWTAVNQPESWYFECFNKQNNNYSLLDQCLQSVIINKSFKCDWIELEHIQVGFFLIDGSLFQTTCCKFCLWRLNSFKNASKRNSSDSLQQP